jgi:hypothetical protein
MKQMVKISWNGGSMYSTPSEYAEDFLNEINEEDGCIVETIMMDEKEINVLSEFEGF